MVMVVMVMVMVMVVMVTVMVMVVIMMAIVMMALLLLRLLRLLLLLVEIPRMVLAVWLLELREIACDQEPRLSCWYCVSGVMFEID
eukprot:981337-Rhodomonas_salina.4